MKAVGIDMQDLLEKITKEYLFGEVGDIVATSSGCSPGVADIWSEGE